MIEDELNRPRVNTRISDDAYQRARAEIARRERNIIGRVPIGQIVDEALKHYLPAVGGEEETPQPAPQPVPDPKKPRGRKAAA